MMDARREDGCTHVTTERKYYHVDGSFIKRSLRPSEWQHNHFNGQLQITRFGNERILNEAATLRFIAKKKYYSSTELYACFEDDQSVYLITEYIDGVSMASLDNDQRTVVEKELEEYLEILRNLKSDAWGGPSGIVSPPYRIMVKSPRPEWNMKPRPTKDLVFCHNDFSTHNVIVDPANLKVKAVIDWEYARFFTQAFEGLYYKRPRPSVALGGEVNDEDDLLRIMNENVE